MASKAERVIAKARTYLGMPYRLGSNGDDGFIDCSGLTQQSYRVIGIELPRVSTQQGVRGTAVSKAQALPGDLIFWSPKPSHVAIYLGNGMMIDAGPSTGVSERPVYPGVTSYRRLFTHTSSGGFLMALTDQQQQQMYDALLGVNGAAHMVALMPFGENLPTSVANSRGALQELLNRTSAVDRPEGAVPLRQEIADTKTYTQMLLTRSEPVERTTANGEISKVSLRQEIADTKSNTITIKNKLDA